MSDLRLRLAEALVGQYTIDRQIGSGGLACVYLEEECKHQRRVANKVLRPELTATFATARIHREIAIAAGLHHPHILPLFDSGEADDLLYCTMPYVEGATVRELLTKDTVLPVWDAVRIARQVASGLSYSHARGIVHRDIEPENILMRDRRDTTPSRRGRMRARSPGCRRRPAVVRGRPDGGRVAWSAASRPARRPAPAWSPRRGPRRDRRARARRGDAHGGGGCA
jgi:serine/threonine protein kinase